MSKKTTKMIKGVAILMMIMHHFCAVSLFPELSSGLTKFGATFKICVVIYAVLSGYGYYFAKEKTIRYGMKKIWGLLEIYWISLFTLFLPIAIMGGYHLTMNSLFINLFGLLPNVNYFAWYVFFYVFCMLSMPFVYKIFKENLLINIGVACIVPYIIEVALHFVPNYESITAIHDLFSCFLYFPCFLIGFLLAKHDIITKMTLKLGDRYVLSLIGLIVVFVFRFYIPSIAGFLLDVIYAPMLIIFLNHLFIMMKNNDLKIINGCLETLGKYSAGIWFFHAVFFSEYLRDIFLPVLKIIKNPILMFVWCVLLSLIGAYIYQKLLEFIHKRMTMKEI